MRFTLIYIIIILFLLKIFENIMIKEKSILLEIAGKRKINYKSILFSNFLKINKTKYFRKQNNQRKIEFFSSQGINSGELEEKARQDGLIISVVNAGFKDNLCMACVLIGEDYRKHMNQYIKRQTEYARQHNYTYITLNANHPEVVKTIGNKNFWEMHPSLSKLPFVEWLLGYFSTVCMIDADIYILNMNNCIHSIIDNNVDIIIQKTFYKNNVLVLQSSTVIFQKNALRLIRSSINKSFNSSKKFPGTNINDWGEQTALQQEIETYEKENKITVKYIDIGCLDYKKKEKCNKNSLFIHLSASNFYGDSDNKFNYIDDWNKSEEI